MTSEIRKYKTPAYLRGKMFEHKVKKELTAMGFLVFRISRSKPIDLIAISPSGKVYLIECKLHRVPYGKEKGEWEETASRYHTTYLAINAYNRHEIYKKLIEAEHDSQ